MYTIVMPVSTRSKAAKAGKRGAKTTRDSASEKKAKMNEGWERAHDAEQNGLYSGLNTAPFVERTDCASERQGAQRAVENN